MLLDDIRYEGRGLLLARAIRSARCQYQLCGESRQQVTARWRRVRRTTSRRDLFRGLVLI